MAIEFTKRYASQADAMLDLAKTTGMFDDASYAATMKDGAVMNSNTYLSMLSNLNGKDKAQFNINMDDYNYLDATDKMYYVYNQTVQDKNATATDDNGKEYNVYENTKEYLDYKIEEAKIQENYENMSTIEKIGTTVIGFLGGIISVIPNTIEGLIDLGVGAYAMMSDDQNAKDFVAKDLFGYNTALNDYIHRYTAIDKSAVLNIMYDVTTCTAQLATAFIPFVGTGMYFATFMGQSIDQAYNVDPNMNGLQAFIYGVGVGGFEAIIERVSGIFGKTGLDRVFFKNAGNSAKVLGKTTTKTATKTTTKTGETVVKESTEMSNALHTSASSNATKAGTTTVKESTEMANALKIGTGSNAGKFLRQAGGDFLKEGVEETISEFTNELWYMAMVDPTASLSAKDIFYSGLIGGLVGGNIGSLRTAFTKNLVVTKDGQMISITEAKEKGITDYTKIGKVDTQNIQETLSTLQNIRGDENVTKLQKKYNESIEDLQKNHADELKTAVQKDNDYKESIVSMATGLSSALSMMGEQQFSKSLQIVEGTLEKKFAQINNWKNATQQRLDADEAKIMTIFKLNHPDLSLNLRTDLSQNEIDIQNALAKFGKNVAFGDFGSEDGTFYEGMTLDDDLIVLQKDLANKMSLQSMLDIVVKHELSHTLQMYLGKLDITSIAKLKKELYDLYGENPLVEDLNKAYDGDTDLTKISEKQANVLAEALSFNQLTIDRVFVTAPNVFAKVFKFFKNQKIKFQDKKDDHSKRSFRIVNEIMNSYKSSLTKILGNDGDIYRASELLDLTDEEIADLIRVYIPDATNENYVMMKDMFSYSAENRNKAEKTLLEARLGDVTQPLDYNNIFNIQAYKSEFVNKINEMNPNRSFKYNLQRYLLDTFNFCISVENKCLVERCKLNDIVNPEIYKYQNIKDFTSKFKTLKDVILPEYHSKFTNERGQCTLENVQIRVSKPITNKNIDGSYASYPQPAIAIRVKDDFSNGYIDTFVTNLFSQMEIALGDVQGMIRGVAPAWIEQGISESLNEKQIDLLAKELLTETRYNEIKNNKQALLKDLSYVVYRINNGNTKVDKYGSESGFRSGINSIVGFGVFKGITIKQPIAYTVAMKDKIESIRKETTSAVFKKDNNKEIKNDFHNLIIDVGKNPTKKDINEEMDRVRQLEYRAEKNQQKVLNKNIEDWDFEPWMDINYDGEYDFENDADFNVENEVTTKNSLLSKQKINNHKIILNTLFNENPYIVYKPNEITENKIYLINSNNNKLSDIKRLITANKSDINVISFKDLLKNKLISNNIMFNTVINSEENILYKGALADEEYKKSRDGDSRIEERKSRITSNRKRAIFKRKYPDIFRVLISERNDRKHKIDYNKYSSIYTTYQNKVRDYAPLKFYSPYKQNRTLIGEYKDIDLFGYELELKDYFKQKYNINIHFCNIIRTNLGKTQNGLSFSKVRGLFNTIHTNEIFVESIGDFNRLLNTIKHEFTHLILNRYPKKKEQLLKLVHDNISPYYLILMRDYLKKNGYKNVSYETLEEEIITHLVDKLLFKEFKNIQNFQSIFFTKINELFNFVSNKIKNNSLDTRIKTYFRDAEATDFMSISYDENTNSKIDNINRIIKTYPKEFRDEYKEIIKKRKEEKINLGRILTKIPEKFDEYKELIVEKNKLIKPKDVNKPEPKVKIGTDKTLELDANKILSKNNNLDISSLETLTKTDFEDDTTNILETQKHFDITKYNSIESSGVLSEQNASKLLQKYNMKDLPMDIQLLITTHKFNKKGIVGYLKNVENYKNEKDLEIINEIIKDIYSSNKNIKNSNDLISWLKYSNEFAPEMDVEYLAYYAIANDLSETENDYINAVKKYNQFKKNETAKSLDSEISGSDGLSVIDTIADENIKNSDYFGMNLNIDYDNPKELKKFLNIDGLISMFNIYIKELSEYNVLNINNTNKNVTSFKEWIKNTSKGFRLFSVELKKLFDEYKDISKTDMKFIDFIKGLSTTDGIINFITPVIFAKISTKELFNETYKRIFNKTIMFDKYIGKENRIKLQQELLSLRDKKFNKNLLKAPKIEKPKKEPVQNETTAKTEKVDERVVVPKTEEKSEIKQIKNKHKVEEQTEQPYKMTIKSSTRKYGNVKSTIFVDPETNKFTHILITKNSEIIYEKIDDKITVPLTDANTDVYNYVMKDLPTQVDDKTVNGITSNEKLQDLIKVQSHKYQMTRLQHLKPKEKYNQVESINLYQVKHSKELNALNDEDLLDFKNILNSEKFNSLPDVYKNNIRLLAQILVTKHPQQFKNRQTFKDVQDWIARQVSAAASMMSTLGHLFEEANPVISIQEQFRREYGEDLILRPTLDKEYDEAMANKDYKEIIKLEKEIIQAVGEQLPEKRFSPFDKSLSIDQRRKALSRLVNKINGLRYLAMLSNPSTHVMNLVSNVGIMGISASTNTLLKTFTRLTDDLYTKNKQLKIRSDEPITEYTRQFVESKSDWIDYIIGAGKYAEASTIKGKRDLIKEAEYKYEYKSKFLNKAHDLIYTLLEKEDKIFTIRALKKEFAHTLQASFGVNTDYSKLQPYQIEMAMEQASAVVLEDYLKADNRFVDWWNNTRNTHPLVGMFMGALLPFPRVASNILIQTVKYSPLGLLDGIGKYIAFKSKGRIQIYDKHGKKIWVEATPDNLELNPYYLANVERLMAKGTTGTGIMILGVILAALGLLGFDDDNEYNGIVLNIGNYKITIGSIAPALAPMILGASLLWTEDYPSLMERMLRSINDITLLGSFDDMFSYNNGVVNAIGDKSITYMTQFVPSILRSLSKVIVPDKKKVSYSYSDVGGWFTAMWQQVINGTPFRALLSNKIDPYTGEPLKEYGSSFLAALNFIMPAKIYKDTDTDITNEVKRVGATTTGASGSFSINGTSYDLSGKELETFAKYRANYVETLLDELINNATKYKVKNEDGSYSTLYYSQMTDEQKQNAIKNVYNTATSYAKVDYWTNNGGTYYFTDYTELNKYKDMSTVNKRVYYRKNWTRSKYVN